MALSFEKHDQKTSFFVQKCILFSHGMPWGTLGDPPQNPRGRPTGTHLFQESKNPKGKPGWELKGTCIGTNAAKFKLACNSMQQDCKTRHHYWHSVRTQDDPSSARSINPKTAKPREGSRIIEILIIIN